MPEYVPLSCDINLDCCSVFSTDICRYASPDYPMQGSRADWRVRDSATSIDIAYQGCPSSTGPELVVDGRADYSVAICEDARCPVYVAGLELELPTGNFAQFSTALFDGECADKTIERFHVQLIHSAIGSRDPLTDRIAFPVGSMVFETSLDVSAEPGELGAGEYHFLAFNDRVVWGHAGKDGSFRFEPSSLSFHELGFDLEVAFDATVAGSPPEVAVTLPQSLECEADAGAWVPLSGRVFDPDSDLLNTFWLVDGTLAFGTEAELPLGPHLLAFQAVDTRGARSVREMVVTVEDTGAPALSVERSLSVTGCDGTSPIMLAVPTVAEACTPNEVLVSGAVVARDGVPLNPRVEVRSDGSVVLDAGEYTLDWTATDAAGNEASASQLLSCKP